MHIFLVDLIVLEIEFDTDIEFTHLFFYGDVKFCL